jgi:EAL domain-containing protein (putative c-di-GMP-specific phosphodiesterase class I)
LTCCNDVGSGANAIVLSRCRVEMIKIDRALISRVRPGEPLPATVNNIAVLARTNKLAVVAEGVKSADQTDALKQAGIPLAKGYYFSHPLSADSFISRFASETGG